MAVISCQDEALGAVIGEAVESVGLDGVIQIEENPGRGIKLEVKEGIVLDRGVRSPFMYTDQEHAVAELDNPYILLCDSEFENSQDLLPALLLAAEDGHPCLVISEGVKDDAMGLIYQNKVQGDMDVVCIESPEYGEGRDWRMDDLTVQTGGVYIRKKMGLDVTQVTREMLGTAEHVKVTTKQTVITGAAGDPTAVENRIKELRYLTRHTDYQFNRDRYKERLAKFVSGVAVIHVGGDTEPEMWEKKLRAEDAVNAARAACEEGVVPGGGVALLDTIPALQRLADTLDGDEKTGAQILIQALQEPVIQIAENAGLSGRAVVTEIRRQEAGVGYDAANDRYIDMVEAGVVDPLKVTRMVLDCAVSTASTLMSVEAGFSKPSEQTQRTQS